MKAHWWKALGVLILLYVLGMGLLVPLGSGISSAAPYNVAAGPLELEIYTYNTRYTEETAKDIRARIRLNDSTSIEATMVNVQDDKTLRAQFMIPEGQLPIDKTARMDNRQPPHPMLEVYSPIYGRALLQSAVSFVAQDTQKVASAGLVQMEAYPKTQRMAYPFLNILEETIRNLYFHVPMWFGMMLILGASVFYSIKHLNTKNAGLKYDQRAVALAEVGVLMGVLGVLTGALWATYTWGAPWSWDVKQNTSAVALLIYLAYFVLRSSFEEADKRARIGAIYNIFAFAMMIPLLYVLPRMAESLHPGMGGNPAFKSYDLDSTMRMVFYPAIIGWTLLGVWLANLRFRVARLNQK